ncbi:diguanylate cyclase [Massilia sp. RP-1-19]|uniref:diguanylate cyclase n=1 Tax=Massilia polaris TaxID=2728846 RepID=A0A848HPX8_9BURK|nr:diguanylate cyclase [Massilia polaris]NML62169.1 diguanylate cyclase [Massilia polaris]
MSEISQVSTARESPVTHLKVRVLLVDDQLIIVEAVRRMLDGQPDIEFHYVSNGAAALETAVMMKPTVILQDLVMPDVDGFALIQAYREQEALASVPVIVLSAREDPKLKAHSFAVGANDYVVKLPDRIELLARVRYHSSGHISRLQRDEAFQFLRESQQRLADANIELQKLAALDGLTGIANRRRFNEVLDLEWQRGRREKTPLSLVMCDIDCFKHHNDTFGHQAGDMCLKKTAAILTGHLKRPADLAARYGGEEFALVLPDTGAKGAMHIAEACRSHLEALAIDNSGSASGDVVTMSVGVATVLPSAENSMEELVARADRALYAAKSGGRNKIFLAPD